MPDVSVSPGTFLRMLLPHQTRIVVLRHAESVGNAESILQGQGDYPLSPAGMEQARQASAVVLSWEPALLAASDLSRAVDTAKLVLPGVDILVDANLRERGAGRWEGVKRAEMEAAFPGSLEDDSARPDDFESDSAVLERTNAALLQLCAHDGLTVAVGHGAVMRLVDRVWGGTGARFANLDGLCLDAALNVVGRVRTLREVTS